MKRAVVGLFRLALILQCVASAQTPDPSLPRLEREIARISKVAGGTVGASAIHIETGRRVSPGLAASAFQWRAVTRSQSRFSC
jgi:hypothetical protein